MLNINNHIYQASLIEVREVYLSIVDNGDQPLYLKLSLCFKSIVTWTKKVGQSSNISNSPTCI